MNIQRLPLPFFVLLMISLTFGVGCVEESAFDDESGDAIVYEQALTPDSPEPAQCGEREYKGHVAAPNKEAAIEECQTSNCNFHICPDFSSDAKASVEPGESPTAWTCYCSCGCEGGNDQGGNTRVSPSKR